MKNDDYDNIRIVYGVPPMYDDFYKNTINNEKNIMKKIKKFLSGLLK